MTKIARFIIPDTPPIARNNTLRGDGTFSSPLKLAPKYTLNQYTPTSDVDSYGVKGQIVWDDSSIYIKTDSGWAKTDITLL